MPAVWLRQQDQRFIPRYIPTQSLNEGTDLATITQARIFIDIERADHVQRRVVEVVVIKFSLLPLSRLHESRILPLQW